MEPDLKTPSSPSRITPTRAIDDAEKQMTKPPAPKYPYVVDEAGVARVGFVAVDPAQHNKATELQLWPLFGSKLTFARPHMRAFHFQWLSFFVAFMAWFAYAPLLVIIRQDLEISTRGIWLSNVCNVAACVVARFVVGPLGDKYGAVRVQAGLLTFVGICTLFSGLPKNLAELCVLRFFIGVAGATFVITQLWTSEMFAKNVVGLSILTQAAEGTTFAIVPFVAPNALGAVAGVVGAGGNVGAVAWSLMFMFGSSGPQGYRHLGIIIILSSFLTLGINIRGAGSLFRNDMDSTIERRARGDDDDESFHTASALTPSSIIMASLPA